MPNATCSIAECEKPRKTRGMCGMHAERVRQHGDPNVCAVIVGDDEARFWSKVDRGDDGCWLWRGTVGADGYGQLRVGGQGVSAHRYSYELVVGPIPNGMQLDHVWERGCFNRSCVNPAHLEPVTLVENVMRGNAYSAVNARKERCIRGHEFTAITRPDGTPRRRCLVCAKRSNQNRAAERRAS